MMSETIMWIIGLALGASISWVATSEYYIQKRCDEVHGVYHEGKCFAKEAFK